MLVIGQLRRIRVRRIVVRGVLIRRVGSGRHYKLSFIQGVAGDGFYVTMGCGMQAEAKKLGNATVNIQGPTKFDPTLQNPIIQSVTAAKA